MLSTRPTSRNAENAHATRQFSLKTPARGLRNENANRQTPAAHLKNVEMKTPFRPADTHDLKTAPRTAAARPFVDKTPYPNRIAEDVQFQTPFTVNMLDFGGSPDSLHRPSSLRKHIRVPRGSLGKEIQTPLHRSDQWDLSDISIELPEVVEATQPVVEDDDFDEIEYMPPNTFNLPYQPPFDFKLPDYKEVGKRLLELAYSRPYDVEEFKPPEVVDMDPGLTCSDLLSVPDVGKSVSFWFRYKADEEGALADDDPFPAPKVKASVPRALPSKAPPATTVAARTKAPSRTLSVITREPVKPRPGTSASVRPRSRIAESSTVAKPRPLSSLDPKRPTKTTALGTKPASLLVKKPSLVVGTAVTTPAVSRRPVLSTRPTTTTSKAVATEKKPASSQEDVLAVTVPSGVLDDDFMFDV